MRQTKDGGVAEGRTRGAEGGKKMKGELWATIRNTNEMMAGSVPSIRPRPILFHLFGSATESKQSSCKRREDGQTKDKRMEGDRQPIQYL